VAFVADLTDLPLIGRLNREQEVDVRAPSLVLDQLDTMEKGFLSQLRYSETTLAPRMVRTNDNNVSLQLAASNYARFLAAMQVFGSYSLDDQRREFAKYSTGTPPWFSHTLGVNCSLETGDGKLMWTVRPPTAAIEPNAVAPVMNEGSNIADVIGDEWDPERVARRGFHEELGFRVNDSTLAFSFYAVVAQFGSGGVCVMGHATTPLTLQEVIEQHYNAIDSHEHVNGLFACDANPESLLAFVDAHPLHEWSTWGLCSLWHVAKLVNADLPDLAVAPIEVETVST
jgi:hypothetical protein